jgi:hypothetical protein
MLGSMSTEKTLAAIKQELYQAVLLRFEQDIAVLESNIRELQSSANEETKSSAGDKYETGRAMMQLEIDNLGQQLHEKKRLRELLKSFVVNTECMSVHAGALAETSAGNFFLLVNTGEFVIDDMKVMVISMQSPLGKLLAGRKAGETVTLNNRDILIRRVY